jgi:ankyrin repeat protein
MRGDRDVAVLLLGAGADPNLTDSDGDSALHTAAGACLPARQQVSDTS